MVKSLEYLIPKSVDDAKQLLREGVKWHRKNDEAWMLVLPTRQCAPERNAYAAIARLLDCEE